MDFDITKYFNELEAKYIDELVDVINSEGIALVETSSFLSSIVVEKWNDECTDFLISKGLECESLCTTAHGCTHLGWIYALFDCSKCDYNDVRNYIDEHHKNKLL